MLRSRLLRSRWPVRSQLAEELVAEGAGCWGGVGPC